MRLRLAHLSFCASGVLCLAGCFGPFDDQADFDGLVADVWLTDFETSDAVEWFDAGRGVMGLSADSRPRVAAFLKSARQQGARSWAVLDEEDRECWVVIVELPSSRAARNAIRTGVHELEARLGDRIEAEWGRRFLALEFDDFDEPDWFID